MKPPPVVVPGEREIIAVVPAHNEAGHIASVVTGARVTLQVLVIDDGSADGTAERARAAGAEVLRLDPNQGKGEALRAGFRWAIEAGVRAVVTLDGDGQHDPAEIPKLLAAAARSQADLVVGNRDFRAMPPSRRLANTLGRRLLQRAVGRDIPDNQSGYRLVSRRLMEAMLESREPGFGFEVEMIAMCLERDWPIAWEPIRTIYAGEKSHINPVTHLLRFIRLAVRLRRRA